ncbi:MAG TPA: cytochrome c oxidase assembly protein [Pirellulales bacterium]|nr:cytochrome c oxidase assembly protein [Pirellulales bacterium]
MSPTLDAVLRSWPCDPSLLATCIVAAFVYQHGWRVLRRRDAPRWHGGQVAAFVGGVTAIYLALASPIEPLASLLLQVHMVQHLLLMMVAPPLVWLGAPLFPLVRGLPRLVRVVWIAPLLSSRGVRRLAERLTHPFAALSIYVAATWLWHIPPAYELALRSSGWHYTEHACFLIAGLVFWYPVVRPYPSRPRWSGWLLLPYLILADVQNTVLSALLTFSGKVIYPYYEQVPRIGNISPLDDQSAAGVIMWVPGSVAFLVPLFAIGLRLLYGTQSESQRVAELLQKRRWLGQKLAAFDTAPGTRIVGQRCPGGQAAGASPRPSVIAESGQWARLCPSHRDEVGYHPLRAFFRWRHARAALQLPLLLLAVAVIYDGLAGPQASPLNLAGVLPWIHWRGLVVLGLLAVGNLSCMACPFTLPRRLAGRWLPQRHAWPRRLQSKWLAVALCVLFLWAYEAFALWDSPWWTAWITLGYFVTAFAVDGFFRGAAFCKYVCPIGQFNFVQSLASPMEIAVYDHQICTTCRTKDCIRGRGGIPGCELELFQQKKSGNMDCTFCLDCVHACPHANVGLVANMPGTQLWHDRLRSGIGRLSQRPDIAALVAVLVFGAFANAAGMVRPVVQFEQHVQAALGISPRSIVTLYYLLAIVVAPLTAVALASLVSQRWAGLPLAGGRMATRYTYALIPLGFGMWLSHYCFHLFTSCAAIVPVAQRFAADLGFAGFGGPQWSCACCVPSPGWLLRSELLFLDFGFLLSLYTAYRLASVDGPRERQALKALLPWSALIAALFLVGVWIVFQPMQMRGTALVGG